MGVRQSVQVNQPTLWPGAIAHWGSACPEEILPAQERSRSVRTIHFEPVRPAPILARGRRAFWSTMPGKTLMAALSSNALTGTILMCVGLPGLIPLPWPRPFAIFAYPMVSCLVVNGAVKIGTIERRMPTAVV